MRNDEPAALHSITPNCLHTRPLDLVAEKRHRWRQLGAAAPAAPTLDRLRDLIWNDLDRAGQRRETKISLRMRTGGISRSVLKCSSSGGLV
jgi:hypothetical protein